MPLCWGLATTSSAASLLLLDPGDVRPENVLLATERSVLLDLEHAAVQRSALAYTAMLSTGRIPKICCGPISPTAPNHRGRS